MNQPLHPNLLTRWGDLPYVTYKGNGEWHSACPVCGEQGHNPNSGQPDRFHMHAPDGKGNARGKCRRCGYFGWADDNKKMEIPSPERIKQEQELRREYERQEQLRLTAKIKQLQVEAVWKYFHDSMKEPQRLMWRDAGIPDEFQDYWQLGFAPKYKGRGFISPALSIPYFDVGWQATNIQYRLISPPKPNDKYRFSYGLKPGLWLTDPDNEPSGPTILVEGMKKAAVLFIELVAKGNQDFTVVAVPSKMPGKGLIARLKDCDPVYVTLDPDAYTDGQSIKRVGQMLGSRARFVRLPAKPDDLFTKYGFTATMMMSYVNQATRAA